MKRHLKKYIFTLLVFLTFVLISIKNKSISQDLFDDSFLGSAVPVAPSKKEEVKAPTPVLDKQAVKTDEEKNKETPPMPDFLGTDKTDSEKQPEEKLPEKKMEEKVLEFPKENEITKKEVEPTSDFLKLPSKNNKKQNIEDVFPKMPLKAEPTKTIPAKDAVQLPAIPPKAPITTGSPLIKTAPSLLGQETVKPSQAVLGKTSTDVFREMADIERENALLTLEIQRQKLQNDIEKLNRDRREALQKELFAKQELERKQLEWEEERERKKAEEEEKKKALKEKKEKEERENTYIKELEKALEGQRRAFLERINRIERERADALNEKEEISKQATETIKTLVSIAEKKILDAKAVLAMEPPKPESCPVCPTVNVSQKDENDLDGGEEAGLNDKKKEADFEPASNTYSIIEIRGKKDDLIVRLATSSKLNFFVRKGTILGTGHVVKDIQRTHIVLEKEGFEEIIAFPAGGIMDIEPLASSQENAIIFSEQSSIPSFSDTSKKTDAKAGSETKGINLMTPFFK